MQLKFLRIVGGTFCWVHHTASFEGPWTEDRGTTLVSFHVETTGESSAIPHMGVNWLRSTRQSTEQRDYGGSHWAASVTPAHGEERGFLDLGRVPEIHWYIWLKLLLSWYVKACWRKRDKQAFSKACETAITKLENKVPWTISLVCTSRNLKKISPEIKHEEGLVREWRQVRNFDNRIICCTLTQC